MRSASPVAAADSTNSGPAGASRSAPRRISWGAPWLPPLPKVSWLPPSAGRITTTIISSQIFRLKAVATSTGTAEAITTLSSDAREVAVDRGRERGVAELQGQVPGLGGPLHTVALLSRADVGGREREQVARRLGVARLGQRLQLADRVGRAPEGDPAASQVETC